MNQESAPSPVLAPTDDEVIASYQSEMQQHDEHNKLAALDMYVAAEALPENADGPAVTKAGLSHEKVMAAGFSGYQEVREESKAWVAAADARDSVSDKELQDEAKAQAKAEGVAREAAYQEEMSRLRAGRDAANARVEGISYKKKLENGGELGLKNNPVLAAQLRSEAVAEAAEEGHDVGHLQPRHYEVVTNPAGEARAAEMAQLLKDHDAAMLAGRSKKANEAESQDDVDQSFVPFPSAASLANGEQNSLNPDMSDFSDEESDTDLEEHYADIEAMLANESEIDIEDWLYEEPLVDTTPAGKSKRIKGLMAAVSAYVATKITMGTQRTAEYFGDEEKGRKRKVGAVIVGAVAVGAAALLVYKGLHDGTVPVNAGEKGQAVNDAARPTAPGNVPLPTHGRGVVEHLAKGQTIWGDVSAKMHEYGLKNTTANIEKVTRLTLKANHLTWEQARHLPTGFSFNLPPQQVMEELLKSKS